MEIPSSKFTSLGPKAHLSLHLSGHVEFWPQLHGKHRNAGRVLYTQFDRVDPALGGQRGHRGALRDLEAHPHEDRRIALTHGVFADVGRAHALLEVRGRWVEAEGVEDAKLALPGVGRVVSKESATLEGYHPIPSTPLTGTW